MSKKHQSLAQNKNLGHLIALVFYIAIGYFLYIAASNMNYVWKWNSIPEYFIYTEVTKVEAPSDGQLVVEDNIYYVKKDDEKLKLNIDNSYVLSYNVGEDVYEGDSIAKKSEQKMGPVLTGLWVTLKISFFSAILTFIIGVIVALMRLSTYQFLKDIATVYITIIRGTPLLVQIFLFYFIVLIWLRF